MGLFFCAEVVRFVALSAGRILPWAGSEALRLPFLDLKPLRVFKSAFSGLNPPQRQLHSKSIVALPFPYSTSLSEAQSYHPPL
ncbi:hypothetical protein NtB2_01408 [Lactococcus termiticola]|uniref:Uncharacterized protein n=1 Tax=Lactococcus termiticola TaxID=2169526 RepID=A0A2R5HKC7_9LACT|nr:hypothetical protein NtB2_01408 [Lactococcus termiticola]